MTEFPPIPESLPPEDLDRIGGKHTGPAEPFWRDRAVWIALIILAVVLAGIVVYLQSASKATDRAVNEPCKVDDKRAGCVAAAQAQGVANQANGRLKANNLPPVPTPSSQVPVPTVTQTVTVPLVGPQGPQGPKGDTGHIGPQGLPGVRGADGTSVTGPAGPSGSSVTGPEGAQGPTGPAGADGKDGTNGTDGATGPQGDPGPSGPSGPAGPECGPGYTPTAQPQLDGGSVIICTSPPASP
jgi:hypothetical protein